MIDTQIDEILQETDPTRKLMLLQKFGLMAPQQHPQDFIMVLDREPRLLDVNGAKNMMEKLRAGR